MGKKTKPIENWLFDVATSCVRFEQLDVVKQLAENAYRKAKVIDSVVYESILVYIRAVGFNMYKEETADLQ